MNYQPLISVIIPVYNCSSYIGKCLHSVITQTYKNLEIIVINNCSTDNSKEICLDFASKDKRIKVIDEPIKGVSFARNRGLDTMRGDYFFFLDSDDYIKNNCLEALLNAINSWKTNIAFSNFFYDLTDKSTPYYTYDFVISGKCLLKDALCRKFDLNPCWGFLFESEYYKDLRFENFKLCEDELYMVKQISRASKISFISDSLLIYRDNKTSVVTAGKEKVYLDGIKAQKELVKYIKTNVPEYLPYAECNYITLAFFTYFKLKKLRCSRDITDPIVSEIKNLRGKVLKLKDASLYIRAVCLLSYMGLIHTYRVFDIYSLIQYYKNRIVIAEGTDTVIQQSTLVSVIVPAYNCEKYLTNCINSIINQNHSKLEIIIVDDGSTDNTPIISDELSKQDLRIKVIHQDNQGLSAARNIGISNSSGEYVCFVDSDDFIHPNFVSILLHDSYLYDSDISMCCFRKVSKNNGTIPDIIIKKKEAKVITNHEALKELVEPDSVNLIVAWNKLYKRNLFDNITFPEGKLCEDNYVAYKAMAIVHKVTINSNQLYFYYQNLSSITHQRDDLSIYQLEALDYYEKYITKNWKDKAEVETILNKSLLKRANMVVEDYYAANKLNHTNRMDETEKLFEEYKGEFYKRNLKLNHKLLLFSKNKKLFLLERRIIEIVGNLKIRFNLY